MTTILNTPNLARLNALTDAQSATSCPDCYHAGVARIISDACAGAGLAGALDALAILREVSGFDAGGGQDRLLSSAIEALKTALLGQELAPLVS